MRQQDINKKEGIKRDNIDVLLMYPQCNEIEIKNRNMDNFINLYTD